MLTTRVTPAEDDLIQALADLAGLAKATHVRESAKRSLPPRTAGEAPRLSVDLKQTLRDAAEVLLRVSTSLPDPHTAGTETRRLANEARNAALRIERALLSL